MPLLQCELSITLADVVAQTLARDVHILAKRAANMAHRLVVEATDRVGDHLLLSGLIVTYVGSQV